MKQVAIVVCLVVVLVLLGPYFGLALIGSQPAEHAARPLAPATLSLDKKKDSASVSPKPNNSSGLNDIEQMLK